MYGMNTNVGRSGLVLLLSTGLFACGSDGDDGGATDTLAVWGAHRNDDKMCREDDDHDDDHHHGHDRGDRHHKHKKSHGLFGHDDDDHHWWDRDDHDGDHDDDHDGHGHGDHDKGDKGDKGNKHKKFDACACQDGKKKDAPVPEPAPAQCGGGGADCWTQLPDAPNRVVHGALLRSGRVLLYAGNLEAGLPLDGSLFNPDTLTHTQTPLPEDLFCSHHAYLPDGNLLVMGGDNNGIHNNKQSYIFSQDPGTPDMGTFTRQGDMAQNRWYPTSVELGDGRVIAVSGNAPVALEVEVFSGGTWNFVTGATRSFPGLYPGLHLIPSGEIFYTRTSWNSELAGTQTAYLAFTGPTTATWVDYGQQAFYDRQEGMSVQTIDTTVSPVRSRIYVFGGGPGEGGNSGTFPPPESRNERSAEVIEFNGGIAGSSWQRIADMNFERSNIHVVALPTGKLMIIGGLQDGGRFNYGSTVGPVETYDPVTNTYQLGASLNTHKGYHASLILLPDGRIVAAGGATASDATMEIYSPSYLNQGPQPVIGDAPATLGYGDEFSIRTSDATDIESVALLRPITVTHHTAPGQRYIKLPIKKRTKHGICTVAPATGNIAPPGDYMLFVVDKDGVPSKGRYVNIAP